jgi:hypothetical protein
LIVSTGAYDDSGLPDLRAPAQDAAGLVAVLGDPAIGAFEVTALLDQKEHQLRLAVDEFLGSRDPAETVLVYFSGHGLLTKWGELYFAAADTNRDRVSATALEARWLTDRLNECRARCQIVILDCCFSGAFIGAKGAGVTGLEGLVDDRAEGGRGRVVLTASRAREYSFEDTGPPGTGSTRSVFSAALIDGLRTGQADEDHDGLVSAFEAHAYTRRRVRDIGGTQTPQLLYRGEGNFYLARSPVGMSVEPAALPASIRSALESPLPKVRSGAVDSLAEWLGDPDLAKAMAARRALEKVAAEDIPPVSGVARGHLDRFREPAAPGAHPGVAAGAAAEPGEAERDSALGVASGETPRQRFRGRALRWSAALGIVAATVAIAVVSIVVVLSRSGQSPSCPAGDHAGSHKVTMSTGAAGTQLVICPVDVSMNQVAGPSLSLSGRVIGALPAGQFLVVVSQPDSASCALDGSQGTGGYYLLKTLDPATDGGNWSLQTGPVYEGAQYIQRHFYFALGPQSAVNSFSQDKEIYGEAHNGDLSSYKGKADMTDFKVLGEFTFTPVQPVNRYCKT